MTHAQAFPPRAPRKVLLQLRPELILGVNRPYLPMNEFQINDILNLNAKDSRVQQSADAQVLAHATLLTNPNSDHILDAQVVLNTPWLLRQYRKGGYPFIQQLARVVRLDTQKQCIPTNAAEIHQLLSTPLTAGGVIDVTRDYRHLLLLDSLHKAVAAYAPRSRQEDERIRCTSDAFIVAHCHLPRVIWMKNVQDSIELRKLRNSCCTVGTDALIQISPIYSTSPRVDWPLQRVRIQETKDDGTVIVSYWDGAGPAIRKKTDLYELPTFLAWLAQWGIPASTSSYGYGNTPDFLTLIMEEQLAVKPVRVPPRVAERYPFRSLHLTIGRPENFFYLEQGSWAGTTCPCLGALELEPAARIYQQQILDKKAVRSDQAKEVAEKCTKIKEERRKEKALAKTRIPLTALRHPRPASSSTPSSRDDSVPGPSGAQSSHGGDPLATKQLQAFLRLPVTTTRKTRRRSDSPRPRNALLDPTDLRVRLEQNAHKKRRISVLPAPVSQDSGSISVAQPVVPSSASEPSGYQEIVWALVDDRPAQAVDITLRILSSKEPGCYDDVLFSVIVALSDTHLRAARHAYDHNPDAVLAPTFPLLLDRTLWWFNRVYNELDLNEVTAQFLWNRLRVRLSDYLPMDFRSTVVLPALLQRPPDSWMASSVDPIVASSLDNSLEIEQDELPTLLSPQDSGAQAEGHGVDHVLTPPPDAEPLYAPSRRPRHTSWTVDNNSTQPMPSRHRSRSPTARRSYHHAVDRSTPLEQTFALADRRQPLFLDTPDRVDPDTPAPRHGRQVDYPDRPPQSRLLPTEADKSEVQERLATWHFQPYFHLQPFSRRLQPSRLHSYTHIEPQVPIDFYGRRSDDFFLIPHQAIQDTAADLDELFWDLVRSRSAPHVTDDTTASLQAAWQILMQDWPQQVRGVIHTSDRPPYSWRMMDAYNAMDEENRPLPITFGLVLGLDPRWVSHNLDSTNPNQSREWSSELESAVVDARDRLVAIGITGFVITPNQAYERAATGGIVALWPPSHIESQVKWFAYQWEVAEREGLTLVVQLHALRDSTSFASVIEMALQVIQRMGTDRAGRGPRYIVWTDFQGTVDQAKQLRDHWPRSFFGVTPRIALDSVHEHQRTFATDCPLSWLLAESQAPHLPLDRDSLTVRNPIERHQPFASPAHVLAVFELIILLQGADNPDGVVESLLRNAYLAYGMHLP